MKKFKLLSLTLSFALLFTSVPVNANTQYSDSTHEVINVDTPITEDSNSNCDVYAELGSEFKVTIPKKITLDGALKKGTYQVTVEGDIAGLEIVKVIPDSIVTLSSKDKADVIGNISQDKTKWYYNEILADSKTLGNGLIEADGITAGSWNGTFNFNINLSETSALTLSSEMIAMSSSDSMQVDAFYEGEKVNEFVTWESDNENITVTNGLVETSALAKPGDSATITVTAKNPDVALMSNQKSVPDLTASFEVIIIDMTYTADNQIVSEMSIKAGSSKEVEVTIIPNSASKIVTWTQTSVSGVTLIKNGNKCTIKIANDMPEGTQFMVIASYGDFAKILVVNTLANHDHIYQVIDNKDGNCQEDGYKLYECTICQKQYTETIPGGHIASGEWLMAQKEHYQECKYCDEIVLKEEHKMGETCCTVCGFEHIIVDTINYKGVYDKAAHTAQISSELEGVTFKYGTAEGVYNLTSIPTFTNAGTYTIYFEATHPRYKTTTGTATVEIEKAEATLNLSIVDNIYIQANTNSDGVVTATSSNTNIIQNCTIIENKKVQVNPYWTGASSAHGEVYAPAGSAIITVTVNESQNYTAASATQKVSIGANLMSASVGTNSHCNYLNANGVVQSDAPSNQWCITNPITLTSGYYWFAGFTGGGPRAILYNGSKAETIFQTDNGAHIYVAGTRTYKTSVFVASGTYNKNVTAYLPYYCVRKITFE